MEKGGQSKPGLFPVKDLLGGLAAAAMLLPQSMAFGVALLTPHGIAAGPAALAGLVCAAALCIASGIAGGTRGIISSPTGPTLVLAGGALGLLSASVGTAGILPALAAFAVLTGIGQILIGATGGGRLIKFIPYSVIVGFMTGSAILMLRSQYAPLFGAGGDSVSAGWIWIPAATALVTFLVAYFIPRLTKHIPATLAGLVGGTLFFHLAGAFAPFATPNEWVIGDLPALSTLNLGFDISTVSGLPWGMLVAAAIAASVLASLDTLLTSVIADVATGERHNARRELMGQGVGQIVSGLSGGIIGAGTTGATAVAISSGGRRWAAVFAGGSVFAIVWLAGGLGRALPVAVLAGIIIRVSVGMLERDIFAWMRRGGARAEAFIALIVTAVTVGYDLMAAVALGVIISVILYLRAQVKAPVIHRRFTAREKHSVCKRTKQQRAILDEHAASIIVCELAGDLFFATADRLYSELADDLEEPNHLILNLRRVRRVDLTGAKILQQLTERLKSSGGEVLFCEVHKGVGIGRDVGETIRRLSPESGDVDSKTFVNTDEALEYVEDGILKAAGIEGGRAGSRLKFSEMDICGNLDADLVISLEKFVKEQSYSKDEVVFREGDVGSELYFVMRGEVDIRLETTSHHYQRLAKYTAGTAFGEVAFLDPGGRTADAVAAADCILAVLRRDRFFELAKTDPGAAIGFLMQLSRNQSEELRWSAREIQRLGDW